MAINSNDAFKLESRKRSNRPIFLYSVLDYDGAGNNLYFAGYNVNVVYDGITYVRFPISHKQIAENTTGSIDGINVQISNVSRLIEAYLQAYDLRGKTISIKMVWSDHLDDPDNFVEFTGMIDSLTSNVKDVVFSVMGKFDILGLNVPGMLYLRDICQWQFKGEECGYTGAEMTCNKTLANCKLRNNSRRFIGFRSIPGRRGYI